MTEHYANAFNITPGECFRLVERDDAHGQPTHCKQPLIVKGRWRDGKGRLRDVEACVTHAGLEEIIDGQTRFVREG